MWRSELVIALVALAGCAAGVPSRGSEHATAGVIPIDREAAARGALVFERNCVTCHGVRGDGRGESARYQEHRPADLSMADYECRSTPEGSLPLPSDIRRSVLRGLPGRTMPSWEILGDAQIDDVVEYARSFSPRWRTEPVPVGVVVPPEPSTTSPASGAALYVSAGCAACHGPGGRGDGPRQPMPMPGGEVMAPTDLTSEPFHCGSTGADLYRTLAVGHGRNAHDPPLSPADVWDLVGYVRALRR